jgi:hypothetical protein
VLKIDVEGHELPVLEGAAGLFGDSRIKGIYLDGYGSDTIPDLLRDHGFALFDGRTLVPCGNAVPDFSLLVVHRSRVQSAHE